MKNELIFSKHFFSKNFRISFRINNPIIIDKNLSRKLKKETVKPIESWTLHGLPNIFRTKYILVKFIWLILFLIALGASIYFVYNTIVEYLRFEVTTVVRSINEDEMDFPVITFCNVNQISNQNGLDYFLRILNEEYAVNYTLETLSNYFESFNHSFYNYDLSSSQLFYQIPIRERENYSASIKEMFSSGRLNDYQLKSDDFNWIHHPYMGNCYQLNVDSKLKSKAYENNVLELSLNMTLPPIVQMYGYGNSIYLFLKSKKSNIFRLYQQNSFIILNGHSVKIQLTKSVYNKQKKPYSDCDFIEDENGNFEYPSSLFDRKYYDQIKQAGYEYSQSMCISFCQLDKIGNNCTFRANSINAPNNMDIFCPDKRLNFLNSKKLLMDLAYSYYYNKQIDAECGNYCPLECKTEKFDSSLTQVRNQLRPNNIDFYINYESLSYLNYEESPSISVYNLVSNIGGAIGLLLGMSLLSIFEVLEMIFVNIFFIFKHKLTKSRQKSKISIV